MAYATVDELAAALRITVTAGNTAGLQMCLDAAAEEIDHAIDRLDPVPAEDPVANRVNILRGVEWFKANDAAFGVLGFDETAPTHAPELVPPPPVRADPAQAAVGGRRDGGRPVERAAHDGRDPRAGRRRPGPRRPTRTRTCSRTSSTRSSRRRWC